MGSPCLFTRQQALKLGYFYWLRVKNYLHVEFSLGYLEDAKFYLESKASFIDISSIGSFELFLIAWLRKYCTFSEFRGGQLEVLALAKIHPVGNYFPTKKSCSTIKLFSSNMFFIRLFLANT